MFFASTYTVLLALFAVTQLYASPAELGVLYTATGLETIIGSLDLASLGNYTHKGRLLMASSFGLSLAVIAFSFVHLYWVSFVLLLVIGLVQTEASALSITLFQLNSPRTMIGLVMSINTLIIMGSRPLGRFPFEALTAVMGVSASIAVGAMISALLSAYLFLNNSKLCTA